MDQLSRLEIFLHVAETGSFTAAGKKINMTGSGVSKQIQNLEDRLKAKLFNRTTRTVSLTEAGELYYKSAKHAFATLQETENELIDLSATPTGSLKVSMPLSFGVIQLAPYIAEFAKQYPEIKLDLNFTDSKVDVVGDGYDVVVRIGSNPDSSLHARRIGPCPTIVCASPEYFAKYGRPQTPDDLKNHQLITYSPKEAANSWTYQDNQGKINHISFPSSFKTDSGEINKVAALNGIGIIILPMFFVLDELKSGELEWVLHDFYSYPPIEIYALYPPNRYLTKKARLFIDMLVRVGKEMEIQEDHNAENCAKVKARKKMEEAAAKLKATV